MSQEPLKIIALGLGGRMEPLLEAAWQHEGYQIAAVADDDPERAAAVARRYECPTYNDYRQLIVRNQADVLAVGAPNHLCAEYIRLAIEKQYHVFKTPPAGVNFEQAAEWIQGAYRQKRRFTLLQDGRFHPLLDRLRHLLGQEEPGFWHLISGVCHVPTPPLEPLSRWLYDPSMAGGGVLLHNTYGLIDELVLCFGMPQQVYAQMMNQAPDRQQRMSLTEDTALVTMRFSDTLIAQVIASRTLGPARQHLRIHGKERFLTLTPEELTACDHSGTTLERHEYGVNQPIWAKRLLTNFVESMEKPSEVPLFPPQEMDLVTMAVMEAAYLSTRTGMPEEPVKILKLAGITTPLL